MRKDVLQWLVPVVLAFALAGAVSFYWWQTSRAPREIEPEIEAEPPAAVEEERPAVPAHPLETTGEEAAARQELRPLPPLEDSDEYFSMELSGLFGKGLEEQLAERNLVERVVATVDNLSREHIADRIKPMGGVGGQLAVKGGKQEGQYVLAPENYERYDALVGMVANTEIARIEELYRRFYPLFQKAYVELGYPQGYFNDRVIEVIDHLLATPEPQGELTLVRPNVLYEYADPALEELSPGQKLLLRMGNEHRATVKERLRQFRGRIVVD
jgi:hypothetical protein